MARYDLQICPVRTEGDQQTLKIDTLNQSLTLTIGCASFICGTNTGDTLITSDDESIIVDDSVEGIVDLSVAVVSSSGDVVGPASAVASNVALFDGTTGKLIKDGGTLGSAAFTASGTYDVAGAAAAAQAASQPLDADLTTWASLTPSANAQSLVTAANYAAMRGLLDLEVGTDFYSISGADAAIAAAAVGLWDDRGSYDASVNTFPASGGSGTAGAILKGDIWTVSVAGTLDGVAVGIGDTVRAVVDTPGQTAGNWSVLENNIGYVPLNKASDLSDLASAPTARGNLGGTTVGQAFFTTANPSAIRFPRVNADNSVTYLSDSDFRTAIGVGAGSGDVVGPGSATDNAIARFDGTTGKLVQNSAVTINDTTGRTIASGAHAGGPLLLYTNSSTTTGSVGVCGYSSAATGVVFGVVGDVDSSNNSSCGGAFTRGGSDNVGLMTPGMDLEEMTAPATPPADRTRIYTKSSDSRVYYKTSGGVEYGPLDSLSGLHALCQGRLTLATGVPVTTTDQNAKTTIYFALHNGNRIGLYDGSGWALYTFTELSLAVGTLTGSLPYDVFVYNNAGTITLELLAWTNATTRATAIAYQDGIASKTGALTRRHLGTVYTKTTTTIEDSVLVRGVINRYNKVPRKLFTCPGYNDNNAASSYTHTNTTWAQANAGTGSTIKFLADGMNPVTFNVAFFATPPAAASFYGGLGIDSTTGSIIQLISATQLNIGGAYTKEDFSEGYHAVDLLAKVQSGTGTYYADDARAGGAVDPYLTYLMATIMG